jgi:hypothetical protein
MYFMKKEGFRIFFMLHQEKFKQKNTSRSPHPLFFENRSLNGCLILGLNFFDNNTAGLTLVAHFK